MNADWSTRCLSFSCILTDSHQWTTLLQIPHPSSLPPSRPTPGLTCALLPSNAFLARRAQCFAHSTSVRTCASTPPLLLPPASHPLPAPAAPGSPEARPPTVPCPMHAASTECGCAAGAWWPAKCMLPASSRWACHACSQASSSSRLNIM